MAEHTESLISPITTKHPELTLTQAAINCEPVELDASPVPPDKAREARRGSRAVVLESMSAEEREEREERIRERKKDEAVIVDIPQTPNADAFEKSGANTADEEAITKKEANP